MRWRVMIWIVVALNVLGCGGGEERGTAAPAMDGAVIEPYGGQEADRDGEATAVDRSEVIFLGDSLTAGLGVAEPDAFPALLARRLSELGIDVEVVNAGVSGDTTAGGLERLDWVLQGEPEVLVVGLGANDGLRGLPLTETESNLRRIVVGARDRGARVLLLGMLLPPNYGPEYAEGFAAIFPRLAEELEIPLVPFLLEGVGGEAAMNQADGIHPNAVGHRRVADNVMPYLVALLES